MAITRIENSESNIDVNPPSNIGVLKKKGVAWINRVIDWGYEKGPLVSTAAKTAAAAAQSLFSSPANTDFALSLASLTRNILKSTGLVHVYNAALKVSGALKIAAGFGGVIAVVDSVQAVQDIQTKTETLKTGTLRIVSNIGWALDSLATCASGLGNLGFVAESALGWVTPVVGAGAALSAVTLAIEGYKWKKSTKGLAELESESLERFQKVFVKDPLPLDVVSVEVDEDVRLQHAKKLQKKITLVENSENRRLNNVVGVSGKALNELKTAIKIHKNQKTEKKLVLAIKARIERKITSHKLKIVSTIVSLIGVAILLAAATTPVGVGLLIVAGISIGIGIWFFDRSSNKKLAMAIEDLKQIDSSSQDAIQLEPFSAESFA